MSTLTSVAPTLDEMLGLTVWRDGDLLAGRDASISVWDHGFLYGDGVFEGIRVRAGLIYRLPLHLARLRRSTRVLGIVVEASDEGILDAIRSTCEANELQDAHIRVIATRGPGVPGIDPRRCPKSSLLVMAYPFPPVLGERPINLLTSSVVRKSPRSVDAHVKSLNYLDAVLAKQQANAGGFDDAVMLDGEGMVAEATGANIFVVSDGRLHTPECTAALPGITRRTVMELAASLSIVTDVRRLSVGDIYLADEAFLTGTGAGIVPIASLDGRLIGQDSRPLTSMISSAYRATWSNRQFTTPLAVRAASGRPDGP